ncbi:MAG: clan AA aspartic protease [Candidatus Omnitrophica bacterium]|nr:clan AA aspartic protease [Candidatus Omnitrophota bacterium]
MPSLPLDPQARRILLRAKIVGPRGKRIVPLILDTGASITTLSHEAALDIGCDPARATRRTEIMTASSVERVPLIVIPLMEVLGHRLRNLEVVCHDLPPVSPVVGLLGLNFLKHFDLHLNFRSRTLELTR